MTELNEDWVLCYDDSGNPAYFPYDKIHPDYTKDGYVLVTAQEFMDHYNLIDGTFDFSYDETYDHFKRIHKGKDVEFEDIRISKSYLKDMVINALTCDYDRCQVFRHSYEDWEFLVSLDSVVDQYFVCDYTVDNILGELGIPDAYELQLNYETSDLQFDNQEIPSIKKKQLYPKPVRVEWALLIREIY